MKVNIKATNLELTAPLKEYIEAKIGSLTKLIVRFEKAGEITASVEVARSSKHHNKGDVFHAEMNLPLPGQLLRAEDKDFDARVAINKVRSRMSRELMKYKTFNLAKRFKPSRENISQFGHVLKKTFWRFKDRGEV